MEWIAAKVRIETGEGRSAADLISAVFYDLGLKGVVMDDPDLIPDEPWGEDAVGPAEAFSVTGYFADVSASREKMRALEQRLGRMEQTLGISCRIDYTRVSEEDWAESWKAFFWPEKITPRITVKPTWRSYDPKPGELVVEIDPGMAFGTGTHPTTRLCIQLMEKYLQPEDAFLDVGTGSGILMAVAAKLGAGALCGIDNDETAVEIAAANLATNQVPRQRVHLQTGDLLQGVQGRYHLIVANILSKTILALLDAVTARLTAAGTLICSGITEGNCDSVVAKMKTRGLEPLEIEKKEGWVAIVAKRIKNSGAGGKESVSDDGARVGVIRPV